MVAGSEAKETCGIDQLCAGLESGIEGGIHAMSHMWECHKMEEDWGFLWMVWHEWWPTGAWFTLIDISTKPRW
jgi:hypothetical protein